MRALAISAANDWLIIPKGETKTPQRGPTDKNDKNIDFRSAAAASCREPLPDTYRTKNGLLWLPVTFLTSPVELTTACKLLIPNHYDALPGRGLEPLILAEPDPKSGASANFATLAIQTPQSSTSSFPR